MDLFSLWLDFGKLGRNESYFYIIKPGVSENYMKLFRNPVLMLRNDTSIQALFKVMLPGIDEAGKSVTLKLILAAPSSPAKLGSVLRSPWGRGKTKNRRNAVEELDEVKINGLLYMFPDNHLK